MTNDPKRPPSPLGSVRVEGLRPSTGFCGNTTCIEDTKRLRADRADLARRLEEARKDAAAWEEGANTAIRERDALLGKVTGRARWYDAAAWDAAMDSLGKEHARAEAAERERDEARSDLDCLRSAVDAVRAAAAPGLDGRDMPLLAAMVRKLREDRNAAERDLSALRARLEEGPPEKQLAEWADLADAAVRNGETSLAAARFKAAALTAVPALVTWARSALRLARGGRP